MQLTWPVAAPAEVTVQSRAHAFCHQMGAGGQAVVVVGRRAKGEVEDMVDVAVEAELTDGVELCGGRRHYLAMPQCETAWGQEDHGPYSCKFPNSYKPETDVDHGLRRSALHNSKEQKIMR